MGNNLKFYIDGEWVDPDKESKLDVINPADESVIGQISMGGASVVDKAVAAARRAVNTFSQTSREERVALLEAIQEYKARYNDMVETISKKWALLWFKSTSTMLTAHLGTVSKFLKIINLRNIEEVLI